MTEIVGRNVTFGPTGSSGITTAMRTKTVSLGNEAIDVTQDDHAGWRTLLEEAAMKQVDISAEGVSRDPAMIAAIISGAGLLEEYELDFPGWGTLTGDFRLSTVEKVAAHNDAVTFSATFQSSGVIAFTPAGE